MVKVVLINPYPFDEHFHKYPIDHIGRFLMSSDILVTKEITSENYMEDIIDFLKMNEYRKFDQSIVGDTMKIFYDTKGTYKMIFLDSKNKKNSNAYNLISSIFHNEAHKVYYPSVIVKLDENNELVDITKDFVIKLLDKRQNHIGVRITKDSIKEVSMNNCWMVSDKSLHHFTKKIIHYSGYHLLILTESDDFSLEQNENTKYIFALIDNLKHNICDFTLEEYTRLKDLPNEEINCENPNFSEITKIEDEQLDHNTGQIKIEKKTS